MQKWIVTAAMLDESPATLRTIANFEGSEEQAMSKFHEIINSYDRDVSKVTRREVYKYSERQYLVRTLGRLKEVEYIMQLGEFMGDATNLNSPSSPA
ncbi:hypothetical protein ACH4UY_37685 [Streptomyces longwoodensis]|uniref:hypothetical protein n=1 Tax=Streptomyces longwoodensis TaxID=68231 RepID=UPI0037AFC026